MSAEDELPVYVDQPTVKDSDAAAYAEFWDDSASDLSNIRIISWWLRYHDRPGGDAH